MTKLARTIEVIQHLGGDRTFSLMVDGEEFPWHIAERGISTSVREDCIPMVTITLIAESLTISNQL